MDYFSNQDSVINVLVGVEFRKQHLVRPLHKRNYCFLTWPNILPDFPRISSKLSAFFFWGIKLLPVLQNGRQIKSHGGFRYA